MSRVIGLRTIAFVAGLGAVVGHKMSPEAMAVVVGVVMGCAGEHSYGPADVGGRARPAARRPELVKEAGW